MKCDVCDRDLIEVVGPSRANIILVGEYPGKKEIKEGKPWAGRGGSVLRKEMQRVGIHLGTCRLTNLWRHPKVAKSDASYDDEYAFMKTYLLREMDGRQAVLLMGSDVTRLFLGTGSQGVNALEVTSEYFPDSIQVAVAMVNPAIVLRDKLGEVRLAIERFGELSKPYRGMRNDE